ncbi:hypothetical protein [Psychromonas hadalis]|uniref:hypothetical protein n=1 Tax=Psychromonas hadalis TaxID=211669 RepID=UPI0003B53931|nr:hypothetical protein [Psychromonas hadalis]
MPIIKQQSSILTEQELQLLASDSTSKVSNAFTLYSYQYQVELPHCQLRLSYTLEQLILMLSASPRGVAVILPNSIESEPTLDKLINLLNQRSDIRVFWLGQLPSMETNLTVFIHCRDETDLKNNITYWQNYRTRTFNHWLKQYRVAFIIENEQKKKQHHTDFINIGLGNIDYFTAQSALTDIKNKQLLIIDINTIELPLIDILKRLANDDQFPIVIIYGQLPANVCRATYTLIENNGFPIFASLTSVPDKAYWRKIFSSLFSKVYLKHWVNEETIKTGAYKLFNLQTDSVISYFCLYGMTKKQIAALIKVPNMRHIINARSLQDWFPDGIKRDIREQLARDLNCELHHVDICIEYPEEIQRTSLFFSAMVMARLANRKIYWLIENENNLLSDILKNFPVSDVILSEQLSHQLLADPSDTLLTFIEQAQTEQVNIVATLQQNRSTLEALSLYGIETVLNKQSYVD